MSKLLKFALLTFIITTFFAFTTKAKTPETDSVKPEKKYKAIPEIMLFSNFHQGVGGDTKEPNFEIKRATFGYRFYVPKGFSSIIRLDVMPNWPLGQNMNLVNVYLRAMYISWQKGKFTLNTGLVDNMQHSVQQKFWGKRYIFKSFLDEYKFLPSIDLGFNGRYAFLDNLSLEFGMMSGTIKDEETSYGKYYYSLALNYNPCKAVTTKLHSTFSFQNTDLYTVGAFAGWNILPCLRLGAEYNAKFSPNKFLQHGASSYIIYDILADKLNIFARYDYLTSQNYNPLFVPSWTVLNDGMAALGGVEWKACEFVRLSLNYQSWLPKTDSDITKSYLFLNVEFRVN